ncbi:MAG TPA: NHL repeat-containing protein, partial [Gemmatimonadaceae bacterium]|nr:NHL repeat-containing protein [Gemmatimonadaceae bacterium]
AKRVSCSHLFRPAAMSSSSSCRLVAALVLVSSLTGCTSDRRTDAERAIRFDTLPGGAVVVTNSERGIWDSASAWRLVEELRIGRVDGDGPDAFSDVHDIAVDGAGNVYVLQRITKSIHVFDPTGRFVRTIGRAGKGPGEFEHPNGMAFDPAGRLWVADPKNGRYVAFDTLGGVLRSARRELDSYRFQWDGTVDSAGRILESVSVWSDSGRSTAYVRFDTTFATADTILTSAPRSQEEMLATTYVLRRGSGETLFLGVPFAPEDVATHDPRGYLWTANTGDYRIVQRDFNGDTIRVVARGASPLPVTSEERAAAIARLDSLAQGVRYDASRIPSTHPVLEWFAVAPDGTLWVALTARDGAAERLFDVFDAEGRYLGQVTVPRGLQPPVRVTRDAIYAVVRDELDVPMVVRLRVVRPAN